MEKSVLNYRVIIEPEKMGRKTVYNASCPTLGVSDWGNSVEEALAHIKEGVECHLESLVKHKKPFPEEDSSEFMIATTKISLPRLVFH